MTNSKERDYFAVLSLMFVGAGILLVMLFYGFSHFGKLITSDDDLKVVVMLTSLAGAGLLLIPLQSDYYEDGVGIFPVIIGAIILLTMLFWKFPEAISPIESFTSGLMLFIGTISVLFGSFSSKEYNYEVGFSILILGSIILFVPILFFEALTYVVWKALTMIAIGSILALAGYIRMVAS